MADVAGGETQVGTENPDLAVGPRPLRRAIVLCPSGQVMEAEGRGAQVSHAGVKMIDETASHVRIAESVPSGREHVGRELVELPLDALFELDDGIAESE